MFKFLFSIFLFSFSVLISADDSHHLLVSVAPHKFFVERIAGDTVTVDLMVPAGSSAHTFEPTPKQMLSASQADIWFLVGESFEKRAVQTMRSYAPNMHFVDLRQNLSLISCDDEIGACKCCHANGFDLHFWLSARLAKIQAQTIATALIQRYPEHQERYQTALEQFQNELDALDKEITELLQPLKERIVMVSHPAYAYFCRDYDLKQLSIEFEGKDPTGQQLTRLLQKARQAHLGTIFIQKQYSNKGAKLIANELGATIVMLDPYSEDFINSMRTIAYNFANQKFR